MPHVVGYRPSQLRDRVDVLARIDSQALDGQRVSHPTVIGSRYCKVRSTGSREDDVNGSVKVIYSFQVIKRYEADFRRVLLNKEKGATSARYPDCS